jgi:RNA polymerase sigma-32 factor
MRTLRPIANGRFVNTGGLPILTPAEEYELAKRYKEHDDRDAADRLVTSHLRLVVKIAMGYRGYGLPVSDLISEGNLGLIEAVRRFEPDKGFRLATYAIWLIRAAIQEYILRTCSLVKLGTGSKQKRIFFNLAKVKRQMQARDDGDFHPEQVAAIAVKLGVTEEDVVSVDCRLSGDLSLNCPLRADDEEAGEWLDRLVDETPNQEERLAEREEADNRRRLLHEAIIVLNERERRIFEARRLAEEPLSLHELSAELGVSHQRVQQIEVRAFDKIRMAVRGDAGERPRAEPRRGPRALAYKVRAVIDNCGEGVRPPS